MQRMSRALAPRGLDADETMKVGLNMTLDKILSLLRTLKILTLLNALAEKALARSELDADETTKVGVEMTLLNVVILWSELLYIPYNFLLILLFYDFFSVLGFTCQGPRVGCLCYRRTNLSKYITD